MLEQYFTKAEAIRSHREGLLGPYLDSFVLVLAEKGYPRPTVREQCWVLGDLGHWLDQEKLSVAKLQETHIDRYLSDRKRQNDRSQFRGSSQRVLRLFVAHLQDLGVAATPRTEATCGVSSRVALVSRYSTYLRTQRGIVSVTIDKYLGVVRRFLNERFGDGPLCLDQLVASDASDFVLRWAKSHSPRGSQSVVTALRSFFRFLLAEGELSVDLAAAVPTVAAWRRSSVPKYLSPEQVQQVLDSCDRSTSTGRRDYAILLLFARLGLRASEVVTLELDDIDWKAGELKVRGKGLFHDRMPLLKDVGEAVATYLSQDRPQCTSRRVFICVKAPLRGFADTSAITTIVKGALSRANLEPALRGAHLLRHSLATGLLRTGASMAEIGEVLRHRTPNTTEIYAKVDFNSLRQLAQVWPVAGGDR